MRGTAKCKVSVSQSKPPRRAFSKGGVAMFGWKSRVRASTGEARRHCHLHYAVTAMNRERCSSAPVHLVEPNRAVARPQLQSKSGKLLIKPETPKSPPKKIEITNMRIPQRLFIKLAYQSGNMRHHDTTWLKNYPHQRMLREKSGVTWCSLGTVDGRLWHETSQTLHLVELLYCIIRSEDARTWEYMHIHSTCPISWQPVALKEVAQDSTPTLYYK